MTRRWIRRPEGSNWGEFGDDDRLGRLNLLTPGRRRAAAAEVREGLVFCLSLPLEVGPGMNPSRHPPRLFAATRDGRLRYNHRAADEHFGLTDVVCDDGVTLYGQYSTQWDALCHVGALFDANGDGDPEIAYYNGFPAAWQIGGSALGIEHMAAAAVQGRAVLVDLARHFTAGQGPIGYEALMRVVEADRVSIEEGDLVCLHTGFAQQVLDAHRAGQDVTQLPRALALDGTDARLLQWVTDSGIAALVADNIAVEERRTSVPEGYAGPLMPLHEHCLFKIGVHLGEMWLLSPLADWLRRHGRHRFLLTAPPLRLAGAAGSPVTPVATV
jgi:kynurenine formamidase